MPQSEMSNNNATGRVDPILSAFIFRKISRKITSRLLPTALTPNQVTLISMLCGLLSAFLIFLGGYKREILGVIILQIAYLLDVVDGDLARAKNMQSLWGRNLDLISDRFTDALLIIATSVAAFKDLHDTSALLWGAFAVTGYLFFNYLTDVWLFPLADADSDEQHINVISIMGKKVFISAYEALIVTVSLAVILKKLKFAIILCTIFSLLACSIQILRIYKISLRQ